MSYRQRRVTRLAKTPQRTHILYLALILVLSLECGCIAQAITVRVVNLANNKPVKNARIYVNGFSETAHGKWEDLNIMTATNGEASLPLPKSAPVHFYIFASLPDSHWGCTCVVRVDTDEVMQKGKVIVSTTHRHERAFPPTPSELLLALRPLPWWVRVLAPLERE
jgi:hypothetical protein